MCECKGILCRHYIRCEGKPHPYYECTATDQAHVADDKNDIKCRDGLFKPHEKFKIIFELQLLDGSSLDVTFYNKSRTECDEIIYKFQEDNVGTKIKNVRFIWTDSILSKYED